MVPAAAEGAYNPGMAEAARNVEPSREQAPGAAEEIPLDPAAVEHAYRFHRAQRRARVKRREETRLAHLRFYLVMLVLVAAALALVIGTWHEVQKLFGL
jgi:hypothetical protein